MKALVRLMFPIRVAIHKVICLIAVVDVLVVSTAYPHGRDSIETYRRPLSADFCETDQAEIHRDKLLNL